MSLEYKTAALAEGKDLYGGGILPDFVDLYSAFDSRFSDKAKDDLIESSSSADGGSSKLMDLALPILDLVNKLKKQVKVPSKDILQSLLNLQIESFSRKARQSYYDESTIVMAHYILCAFIDEILFDACWSVKQGGQANDFSLLHHFVTEEVIIRNGNFFAITKTLCNEPQKNLDLLELCYLCLKLGFTNELQLGHDDRSIFEKLIAEVASHISSASNKLGPSGLLIEPSSLIITKENIPEIRPHRFFSRQLGGIIALIIVIGLSVFMTLNIKLNRITRPLYKLNISNVAGKNTDNFFGVNIARPELVAPLTNKSIYRKIN